MLRSMVTRLPPLAAFLLATASSAFSDGSTKIGELECFVAPGSGYVVGSSKDISCTLYDLNDQALENYIGELKKYGVDIGFTKESLLQWSVFVPEKSFYQQGSLAGNYAGASATASLAIGLGASVLIGGLSENFALQPIKISRQRGINIAVGITRMELRPVDGPVEETDEPVGEAAGE